MVLCFNLSKKYVKTDKKRTDVLICAFPGGFLSRTAGACYRIPAACGAVLIIENLLVRHPNCQVVYPKIYNGLYIFQVGLISPDIY